MGHSLRTYLLVTEKSWHNLLFEQLNEAVPAKWIRCSDKRQFNVDWLASIQPDLIFIPHWSYIIPEEIFLKYECILFHMTDLPYGRGGSPLQNLIVKGHTESKISAIKITEGIDQGPVYLKRPLLLHGTAREIFVRASGIIKDMIVEIIESKPIPQPQQGEVVLFKRRKPEEGDLSGLKTTKEVYDYIRMLDAEGYPNAFIETKFIRFEFTQATFNNDNTITAHVRILQK